MQQKPLTEQEIKANLDYVNSVRMYGTAKAGYKDSGIWRYAKYAYTNDSHDVENPVKLLPMAEKLYLRVMTLFALACPVLFMPKSRQIMVSWWMAMMASWWVRQGPYRRVVWQSKKKEDAIDMVSLGKEAPALGRIDHIEKNLRHAGATYLGNALYDLNVEEGTGNQVGKLVYTPRRYASNGSVIPWYGSIIQAIPQGGEQIRGKTTTLTIADEAAFQDEFQAAYESILPAMKDKVYPDGRSGTLIAASSIEQGFFVDACLEPDENGKVVWDNPIPESIVRWFPNGLPKGMRSRKTPSGIWVLKVHYSADPAKDPDTPEGLKWVKNQSAGYVGGMQSSGWLREMEIDYSAKGGEPIFPFLIDPDNEVFSPKVSAEHAGEINEESVYYAGYDYGSSNPSHLGVWEFNKDGKAYKVWELHEPCVNYIKHTEKMKKCPYWDVLEYIVADPAMWIADQQAKTGKTSMAELFATCGVFLRKGNRGVDVTITKVFQSKYWGDPKNPLAYITDACPDSRREYRGLRRAYQSTEAQKRKNKPEDIMQKDNHAVDADCYLFDAHPIGYIEPITSPPPGSFDAAVAEMDMDEALSKAEGGIVCL